MHFKGGSGTSDGYTVKKTGDATAVLIGLPSVGKSTILGKLTNKKSKVGSYAFTTLEAIPGLMDYKEVKVQIFDLPGIISGASKGKGRGKEVLSAARSADLVIIVVDCFTPQKHLEIIHKELEAVGIRLNKEKPNIRITKTGQGGIQISSAKRLSHLNEKLARSIGQEYRVNNASLIIYGDPTVDELIDVFEENRVYLKAMYVVNKIDMATPKQMEELEGLATSYIPISAEQEEGLVKLKDEIVDTIDLIRLYMKPQGKPADYEEPLIIPNGSSIGDVCDKLHKHFRRDFKYARIWGKSAKHPGQMIGLDHVVKDKDVLTLVLNKS